MAGRKKDAATKGVYDRGSSWQVRISGQDASGHTHRINRTFPYNAQADAKAPDSRVAILKQAAAFATAERAALHVEKQPASGLLRNQSLNAWIARYIEEVCPTKKAGRGDADALRLMQQRFPNLCSRGVESLTPKDFGMEKLGFARVLYDDYMLSESSIVRHQTLLSHVITTAIKNWHFPLRENPIRKASRPSVSNQRERVVTDQEWTRLQEAMAALHPSTRAAIAFLRWTGCRRGEAIKLRWEDIALEGTPQVVLRDTKTPKKVKVNSRTIPLHPNAVSVLQQLLRELGAVGGDEVGENGSARPSFPGAGAVFSTDGGKAPIAGDSVTQAWSRACAKAAIEGATLHDLRHTRITELANLLPLHKVMRISGHKTSQMLMRYYNPKVDDLARDLAQAEQAKARGLGE
ncbi:site-specific integrase [Stenotrophomonas sp. PS02300]|uniref:tyrosine-type recombinase/integrase n=1 Tax=Stenotrophomonas sp. PS02300 TaxID=2991426 RepID=UPI00249C74AD|nr:site-specific integrase [Stenotrophomonas sp. PS02300]